MVNRFDGRLNRRIICDETGGGGDLKHFYYNEDWQALVEADPNGATGMYAYHPHYVDAVAVRIRDEDAHAYLQDANFNVTALVDPNSTVVERYSYTPYGEVTVLNADFSVDPNGTDIGIEILYTGRRLDPETGLQLNRNRFFTSLLGRWLSRDPILYEGSQWNLYEYVEGKPVQGTDPDGLKRFGTNECKRWCDEAEICPRAACKAFCKLLKNASCKGVESLCNHLLRHRQKKAAEICWLFFDSKCGGQ